MSLNGFLGRIFDGWHYNPYLNSTIDTKESYQNTVATHFCAIISIYNRYQLFLVQIYWLIGTTKQILIGAPVRYNAQKQYYIARDHLNSFGH